MENENKIRSRLIGRRPGSSLVDAYVLRLEQGYAVCEGGNAATDLGLDGQFVIPLELLPARTARGVTLRLSIEAIKFPTPEDELRFAEEDAEAAGRRESFERLAETDSEEAQRKLEEEQRQKGAEAEIQRRAEEDRVARKARRKEDERLKAAAEEDMRRKDI